MCLGNMAEASARFINAQLSSLWENARLCKQHLGHGTEPNDGAIIQGTALHEFSCPGRTLDVNSSPLHAIFDPPRIEFICNHELLLVLVIKEGQYDSEIGSSAPPVRLDLANSTVALRMPFEIKIVQADIDNYKWDIGLLFVNASHVQLVPERSFLACPASKVQTHKPDSLAHWLTTHYVPTLLEAGHLHLSTLPPMLRGNHREIDHAQVTRCRLRTEKNWGIALKDINELLVHRWLTAVTYLSTRPIDPLVKDEKDIFLAEHRTHWDDAEMDVLITFGPLTLEVLCEREVVLFVNVPALKLYGEHSELANEVKDWKLALIFEIVHKEGRILLNFASLRECLTLSAMEDSQLSADARDHLQRYLVTHIKEYYMRLIFESTGGQLWPAIPTTTHTPVDPGCSCPKRPQHVKGCPEPRQGGCHCPHIHVHVHGCPGAHIPKPPHRGPTHVPRAGEPWPPTKLPLPKGPQTYPGSTGPVTVEWALLWELFIKESSLHGHHSITTVSQAGINAHFVALWKSAKELAQKQVKPGEKPNVKAVLAEFSSEHYTGPGADVYIPHLHAQLAAPQVELDCSSGSKSVIIYFHIERGSIKTREPQEFQFNNWLVAFKVELKLVQSEDAAGPLKEGTSVAHFRQLILDFSTAQYLSDRSYLPGLVDQSHPETLRDRFDALIKNFTRRYIPALVDAHYDALYTLPIHDHQHITANPTKHHPVHAVTDVTFSIIPFHLSHFGDATFQGLFGPTHHIVERNMIVFHGVTGGASLTDEKFKDKKLLPGPYGPPSHVPSHGTVILAREVFLEKHVLKPLESVNALTTFLIHFSGVGEEEWFVDLCSWMADPIKSKSRTGCVWKVLPPIKEGHLSFGWNNTERWDYDATGSATSCSYSVCASTDNTLSIPTEKSVGVIELHGHVEVHLTHEEWSGTVLVTWEAPISFTSDVEKGLVVATRKKLTVNQPTSEGSDFAIGKATLDKLSKKIQKDLESAIDISSIVANLRQSFGGVYNGLTPTDSALVLSNPVFNLNGDLLAQLRVKGGEGVKPSVKPIITTGTRAPSKNTPTSAIRSLFGKGTPKTAFPPSTTQEPPPARISAPVAGPPPSTSPLEPSASPLKPSHWQQIDNCIDTVDIVCVDRQLFQMRKNGCVLRHLDNKPGEEIGADTVQIVSDGKTLYGRQKDGKVFEFSGTPHQWKEISDDITTIGLAAAEGHLYRLCSSGAIMHLSAGTHEWESLNHHPDNAQIATDGQNLYARRKNGEVYHLLDGPAHEWEQIDHSAETIDIIAASGRVYIRHDTGSIYLYSGKPSDWKSLDTSGGTLQLIADGEHMLYQVRKTGTIQAYDHRVPAWHELEGCSDVVQVAAHGGRLYSRARSGAVFSYQDHPQINGHVEERHEPPK